MKRHVVAVLRTACGCEKEMPLTITLRDSNRPEQVMRIPLALPPYHCRRYDPSEMVAAAEMKTRTFILERQTGDREYLYLESNK